MITRTSQGIASRLGYGLGRIVLLVWCSQNRTLRWVKRVVVSLVLLYFSAEIYSGIASVAVITMIFGTVLLALSARESSSSRKKVVEYGSGYGPQGYGYYKAGRRVDDDD